MSDILNRNKSGILFFAKVLLFCSILTAGLLLLLSFFLYQFGWGEKAVSIAVILIYLIATFFGGWMAGGRMEKRKFLWGLLAGCLYYLLLSIVSAFAGGGGEENGKFFLTTFVLCAAGGMLGGMFSKGQ